MPALKNNLSFTLFNHFSVRSKSVLFFVDASRKNIFEMSASGGNHTPLINNTKIFYPMALTYDQERSYIYWTDYSSDSSGTQIGRYSTKTGATDFFPLPTSKYYSNLVEHRLKLKHKIYSLNLFVSNSITVKDS